MTDVSRLIDLSDDDDYLNTQDAPDKVVYGLTVDTGFKCISSHDGNPSDCTENGKSTKHRSTPELALSKSDSQLKRRGSSPKSEDSYVTHVTVQMEKDEIETAIDGHGNLQTGGLVNLHNTCYMNAVIQFIFAMSSFRERYLNSKEEEENKFNQVMCELANELYRSGDIHQVFSPTRFRDILSEAQPAFGTSEQQDAMECLLHIVRLVMENNRAEKNPCTSMRIDLVEEIQDGGHMKENPRTEYVLPLPIPSGQQVADLSKENDATNSNAQQHGGIFTSGLLVVGNVCLCILLWILKMYDKLLQALQACFSWCLCFHDILGNIRTLPAYIGRQINSKYDILSKYVNKLAGPTTIYHTLAKKCTSSKIFAVSRYVMLFVGRFIQWVKSVLLDSCRTVISLWKKLFGRDTSMCFPRPKVLAEECIELLMKRQNISGIENLEKTTFFRRLPRYMVIGNRKFHLNASGKPVLSDVEVEFPMELDVTGWRHCSSRNSYIANKVYELLAVVKHIGQRHMFGHYVCYVRRNDTWRMYSDSSVQEVTKPPLSDGYLYLYVCEEIKQTKN